MTLGSVISLFLSWVSTIRRRAGPNSFTSIIDGSNPVRQRSYDKKAFQSALPSLIEGG